MYPIEVFIQLQGIFKYEFLIVIAFKVAINLHKVARTVAKERKEIKYIPDCSSSVFTGYFKTENVI